MSHDLPLLSFIATVFIFAGVVKGVIGMGLPTVSMGLLAVWMPPAEAAALLLLPSFVTNVWQLMAGPKFAALLKRLWSMMAGIWLGTVVGSGMLAGPNTKAAVAALGVALIAYALLGLSKKKFHIPERAQPWLSPIIGALTGVVTGATGVFVIPAVPYLQAIGLEKDDLIQALGLSFTMSTIALAAGLSGHHALDSSALLASLVALAPAMLGMALGQVLRTRLSPETFRKAFLGGLLALGAYLAVLPP